MVVTVQQERYQFPNAASQPRVDSRLYFPRFCACSYPWDYERWLKRCAAALLLPRDLLIFLVSLAHRRLLLTIIRWVRIVFSCLDEDEH